MSTVSKNNEKIYFFGGDKAENVGELIKIGFSQKFSNAFDRGKFVTTYHDKECERIECYRARRSFSDLYNIATTYFPEATRAELAYTLIEEGYYCFICPDIDKLVFMRYENEDGDVEPEDTGFSMENGEDFTADYIGEDGYSYENILELASEY